MPNNPSTDAPDSLAAEEHATPIDQIMSEQVSALQSPDFNSRLAAIEKLARLEVEHEQALRLLEKTAALDENKLVRQAALQALDSSLNRSLQRRLNRLSGAARQTILAEIERWQADGLIKAHTATLLRQRYHFASQQTPQTAAAAPPAAPPRSLSEVLLSETTIKVALYLGAFFVISAACILTAIIEFLRLPILAIATVGFLGVSLGLKRRLPQASFILFVVFSFLLPIDAAVLIDQFGIRPQIADFLWVVVALGLSLVWSGATFLYVSRFFSLLALAAAGSAALLAGRWLDVTFHLDLFLISLAALAGLGGVYVLRRWQDQPFSRPLLGLVQLQQASLLTVSAMLVLVALFDEPLSSRWWWLVIATTWLLATVFYDSSYGLTSFALFPPLAVAALLPVPLLLLEITLPGPTTVALALCGWGALVVLAGEGLARVPMPGVRVYSFYLIAGSALVFALAAVVGLSDRIAVGLGCLLVAAVTYLGLSFYRPRWWVWSGALLTGTAAYFTVFFLPDVEQYNFYPGFILLWPTLTLLALSTAARRGLKADQAWHLPPLILGGLTALITLPVLLLTGFDEPARAAIAFGLTGSFLALAALIEQRPAVGYSATASLVPALAFGLIYFDQETWIIQFTALAALYFVAGFGLTVAPGTAGWAVMMRWSGLILGAAVSFTAPLQGGAAAVIGPALAATFFAIEAFYRRNIWLGFPTNLLYLGAYFILLVELDVSEPQVYSIGAALLGFIMHYLLVRSKSNVAAFFTGLVSQLILLSTTYIQMFATERFLFFFVLFVQSLVVLVYGLVVRSKSLVIAPIIFVVLGVITVTLSVLAGIPALILVGCTGLLLLLLGIAALLLREQLLTVTSKLSERLDGWRA